MKAITVTGRSPFPLRALRNAVLADAIDEATVVRSIRLGHRFHGVVELERTSRDAMAVLRDAGWKRYVVEPVRPNQGQYKEAVPQGGN